MFNNKCSNILSTEFSPNSHSLSFSYNLVAYDTVFSPSIGLIFSNINLAKCLFCFSINYSFNCVRIFRYSTKSPLGSGKLFSKGAMSFLPYITRTSFLFSKALILKYRNSLSIPLSQSSQALPVESWSSVFLTVTYARF